MLDKNQQKSSQLVVRGSSQGEVTSVENSGYEYQLEGKRIERKMKKTRKSAFKGRAYEL